MLRIPLGDLDELCSNPAKYKATRASPTLWRGGSPSYFQTLRNGIFEYHKDNDFTHAIGYLEERLERFKDAKKCEMVINDFHWYVAEVNKLQWPTFSTKLLVEIPLSTQFHDSFTITGQVSKVDINPKGGYGAWFLRRKETSEWQQQIQMPITQNAVAIRLKTDPSTVSIVIYNFLDHEVDYRIYSAGEIKNAHLTLENALRQMGF